MIGVSNSAKGAVIVLSSILTGTIMRHLGHYHPPWVSGSGYMRGRVEIGGVGDGGGESC